MPLMFFCGKVREASQSRVPVTQNTPPAFQLNSSLAPRNTALGITDLKLLLQHPEEFRTERCLNTALNLLLKHPEAFRTERCLNTALKL